MIPANFDYHAPQTLGEALTLLGQIPGARVLAGGHSLLPAMRFRLAVPGTLIDINGISELSYLQERDGYLAIGAMTRESALEDSAVVQSRYPLLADTARVIADPLVRNHATVGGNLAHSDPANDHPATMLAYNAQIVATGPSGPRVIAIDDFFTGLFDNALNKGELLTEIRVPAPTPRSGGAYLKLERKVGDYAIAAVAVQLELDAGGNLGQIRIGLTNVSPVPARARNAEDILRGQAPTEAVLEAAARAAAAECEPSGDLRGQEDYKRDMVRVLAKRALRTAIARAQGGKP